MDYWVSSMDYCLEFAQYMLELLAVNLLSKKVFNAESDFLTERKYP